MFELRVVKVRNSIFFNGEVTVQYFQHTLVLESTSLMDFFFNYINF